MHRLQRRSRGLPPADAEHDGHVEANDNCPGDSNSQFADTDGDGAGNACDYDSDSDGSANGGDNCVTTYNPSQADRDRDGIGDACDGDRDGDGRANSADGCPDLAAATSNGCPIADSDGDGIGDPSDGCPYEREQYVV